VRGHGTARELQDRQVQSVPVSATLSPASHRAAHARYQVPCAPSP
jgi:hypothetical protein